MTILGNFKNKSVIVVGDLMVDRYIKGRAVKISQEAPVPVVRYESEEWRLGGAANVAANLAGLGARPYLIGVTGSDHEGRMLANMLSSLTLTTAGVLVDNMMHTTVKMRVVANNQQMLRVDREDAKPISEGFERALVNRLMDVKRPEAIIIEDYAKGVITPTVANCIMESAHEKGIPVMLDPHPRGVIVKGSFLMTPNLKEARFLANANNNVPYQQIADAIHQKYDSTNVAITLGEDGIYLSNKETKKVFQADKRQVFDVSGAGDTVIAVMTLGIISGLTVGESTALANLAAGIVVTQPGTTPITLELLKKELKDG